MRLLANILALVGGAWAGISGILLLGLLWIVAEDPSGLFMASRTSLYAVQTACVAALLMGMGVVLSWAGLRLTKSAALTRW